MAFQSVRSKKGKIIDFECLLANEAAKNIVGKKEYDLIGQKLLAILPENLKEGLFEKYVEVVETGEPLFLEHNYLREGKKI
jgi:hypothetical protein